eukprot:c8740_g1_i1.p1 GENE.c8740_g1_i1~~c8740_g1_i1.p1  ORF type:complete len:253 (+),score=35.87 c8740_g1_i1:452-1210(+)
MKLSSQDKINDISEAGRNLSKLLSVSLSGDLDESSEPPKLSQHFYIAVGAQPMICTYCAENKTFSARQIVSAVARSVKSYASSWVPTRWARNTEQPAPRLHVFISAHCELRDGTREFVSVVSEAKFGLAAACDTLGRVLLVDTKRGVCLRIWKGYRDAQCCILARPDPNDSLQTQPFLVIYAPRRSLVEVWRLAAGERVFAVTIQSLFGSLFPDEVQMLRPPIDSSQLETPSFVVFVDLISRTFGIVDVKNL